MVKKLISIFALVVAFAACSKDDNGKNPVDKDLKISYIVVNEGIYSKGTADISVVYEDGTADWNMFEKTNHRPLGDVAQHIEYMNGKYYITLNNSKKIEVIDCNTFVSKATIAYTTEGRTSPLYMAQISQSEAVVSNYSKVLTVIDIENDVIKNEISLETGIYKMAVINNKLFGVASNGTVVVFDCNNISKEGMRTVKKFETEEGQPFKTFQSAKLIKDYKNNLWILATTTEKCYLVKIDPATETVSALVGFEYDSSSETGLAKLQYFPRVDTDKNSKVIFFTAENKKGLAVYSYDIASNSLNLYKQLDGVGMLYGMGVSPEGNVVALDCLDYSAQRGYAREYSAAGVKNVQVGTYPRMVHFRYYDYKK